MHVNPQVQALLDKPVAQELLHSKIPARLAFVARDGTPRVTPLWFHWNGKAITFASGAGSAKVKSLRRDPNVAITIDSEGWPYKMLRLRGQVRIEEVEGVVPEYELAAVRYYGPVQGKRWLDGRSQLGSKMARLTLEPAWAELLDFRELFSSINWDEGQ